MNSKPYILLPLLLISFLAYSQKEKTPIIEYDDNVDLPLTVKELSYINEAYAEYANQYILSRPNRLREIKNILRNRVQISEHKNKDLSSFTNLSEVSLFTSYNKTLKRSAFNIDDFNPLRYNFNFYSKDDLRYYRVDNTQYLIAILPQHAE